MMEYKWEIADLTRDVADGFVLFAKWRLVGIDGDYSYEASGICGFDKPTSVDTITPFEQLTEDQILTWVWSKGFDKVENEAFVASMIEQIKQDQSVSVANGLPWNKEATV